MLSAASGCATGPGSRSPASWNVLRTRRRGSAGVDVRTSAAVRGSSAAAIAAPIAPIECPRTATAVTPGRAAASPTAASVSAPNSAALIGSASGGFSPWPRTSNMRVAKPAACRNAAFGSIRARFDSQPWTSTTAGAGRPPGAGTNQPGNGPAWEGTSTASNGRPYAVGVSSSGRRAGKPARRRYSRANR